MVSTFSTFLAIGGFRASPAPSAGRVATSNAPPAVETHFRRFNQTLRSFRGRQAGLCEIARFDNRDLRWIDVLLHCRADLVRCQLGDFLLESGIPSERTAQ